MQCLSHRLAEYGRRTSPWNQEYYCTSFWTSISCSVNKTKIRSPQEYRQCQKVQGRNRIITWRWRSAPSRRGTRCWTGWKRCWQRPAGPGPASTAKQAGKCGGRNGRERGHVKQKMIRFADRNKFEATAFKTRPQGLLHSLAEVGCQPVRLSHGASSTKGTSGVLQGILLQVRSVFIVSRCMVPSHQEHIYTYL